MNTKIKSVLFIVISLSFGILLYILFRPPLSWFPDIKGWDKAIIDISWLPSLLSSFILYHLSDIIWSLALAEAVYLIKNNLILAVISSLILTILFELLQILKVVKGTGDIWDIIFVTVFLSIYYFIKRKGYKNEKET